MACFALNAVTTRTDFFVEGVVRATRTRKSETSDDTSDDVSDFLVPSSDGRRDGHGSDRPACRVGSGRVMGQC